MKRRASPSGSVDAPARSGVFDTMGRTSPLVSRGYPDIGANDLDCGAVQDEPQPLAAIGLEGRRAGFGGELRRRWQSSAYRGADRSAG
jgi:hypothetical protein